MITGILSLALASCAGGSDPQGSRGSAYVLRLHEQAIAKGYDGQARLLADGRVSFAELREANQALIRCAERRGVIFKAHQFTDMQGPAEIVESVDTSGPVDADLINRVGDVCQNREQMLVDQAYTHGLPDLTETAYQLWARCAAERGYQEDVPRSYRKINIDLPPEVLNTCERWVTGELEKVGN